MVSKAFKLATIAKSTSTDGIIEGDAAPKILATYTSINLLPLSGNQSGDMAYIDSSNKLYIYTGDGWYSLTLIEVPPIPLQFDALIVAGGGAGGSRGNGGGGGAGGMVTLTNYNRDSDIYSITVGDGGTYNSDYASPPSIAENGGNSLAFGQTAVGGGSGADFNAYNYLPGPGQVGGSGGGGSGTYSPRAGTSGGAGTSGQGNAGGDGFPWLSGTGYRAGSGGGAGTAGSSGGNGGDGLQWLDGNYYAGGGGAGVIYEGGSGQNLGGLGGGGDASCTNPSLPATDGATNTGGGGGGGGAAGGSGIVAIRYFSNEADPSFSGTYNITDDGTYKYFYCLSSGILSW